MVFSLCRSLALSGNLFTGTLPDTLSVMTALKYVCSMLPIGLQVELEWSVVSLPGDLFSGCVVQGISASNNPHIRHTA